MFTDIRAVWVLTSWKGERVLERRDETKSPKYARIPYKKWTEKMCLIPLTVPLSATVNMRRWCSLTAPPAVDRELRKVLLKGMSGEPEELFKVDRWS